MYEYEKRSRRICGWDIRRMKVKTRKITHYPKSKRYKVKNWKQRHKLVFKQPKTVESRPLSKKYIQQEKFDGSRMQLIDLGEEGLIVNRRGVIKCDQFPEFYGVAKKMPGVNIIDGEMIIQDKKGLDNFKLLAEREHLLNTDEIKQKVKQHPAKFMAFDALVVNNEGLLNAPLKERQKKLVGILPKHKNISKVKSHPNTKENFQKLKNKPHVEGIVFKDLDSGYNDSKNVEWLKLKNTKDADIVVTGFEEGKGKRKGQVGNMTMSVLTKDGLKEIGKVGTGWDEKEGKRLLKELRQRKKVFAKVRYLKKGSKGNLREPSYQYQRDDISLRDTHASRPIRIKKKGRIVTTRTPEEIRRLAKRLEKALKKHSVRITVAGSIRRSKTPVDIDIVVIPKDKKKVKQELKKLGARIHAEGDQEILSRLKGIPVDIFFSGKDEFGAQLMTRTGPAGANISNRALAKKKGLLLNQHGLFKGKKKIAGKTEAEIYHALGKTYRPASERGKPR
jgi:bifunctional non-homologous end joining protein LigD